MTSQERHLLTMLARLVRGSGLGTRADKQDLATAIALVATTETIPLAQPDGAAQDGAPAMVKFTDTGPTLVVFGVATSHWDGILHDSLASNLRDDINAAYKRHQDLPHHPLRAQLDRYRYATRASLSAMFADGRASAVPLMWARSHDDGSKDINAEALHAQLEQWAKEKRSGAPAFVPEGTTTQALQLIWSYRYAVHRALRIMFGRGGDAARPLTWALDRDPADNVFDDAPLLRDFEEWNKKTPRAPLPSQFDDENTVEIDVAPMWLFSFLGPSFRGGPNALPVMHFARADAVWRVLNIKWLGPDDQCIERWRVTATKAREKKAPPSPTAPDNPTRAGGAVNKIVGADRARPTSGEHIGRRGSSWATGGELSRETVDKIIGKSEADEFAGLPKFGERILTPEEARRLTRAVRGTGPEERAAETDISMGGLGVVAIMSLDKDGRLHVDQEALDKLIKDVVHSWISKPGAWLPRREPASEFDPSQLRVEPVMRPAAPGQAGPGIEDMTSQELREIADDLMAFAGHNVPRSVHRTQKRAERCRQIADLLDAIRAAGQHPTRGDLKAENAQLQFAIDEAFKILDGHGGTGAQSRQERALKVLMTALSPAAPSPGGVVSSWQEETQRLRGIIRDAHRTLTASTSSLEDRVSAAVACMIPGLTPPVVAEPEE